MQSVFQNLSSPMILFFLLGLIAGAIKSNLEIPEQIAKGFSLYFLIAIGLKGGAELSKTGFDFQVMNATYCAVGFGILIPIIAYFLLWKIWKINISDSAAIAAHYGSVSVVTFVTTVAYLEARHVAFNGYLIAMMALMESPAIFISIFLVRIFKTDQPKDSGNMKHILREALLNASIILLFGSLVIGFISGDAGFSMVKPFFAEPFNGVLAFFLLEMGLIAGKRLEEFKEVGLKLVLFGIIMPIVSAVLAILVTGLFGMQGGDRLLFAVLAASASYIAAPAAVRLAIPEANPTYYITLSLAITFPFNVLFGITFYDKLIMWL